MPQQLELSLPPPNPPLPTLLDLWTPDDIYAALDAALLGKFREDRRLERKTARTEPRVLGEYFSMWANTSPEGGIIIVGMEDDGRMTGCLQLSDTQKNAIDLAASRFCPDSRSDAKRVQIVNESGATDFVIAIRIFYRTDKLVETTAGDAFIRIGDEKHRLIGDEKREVRIGKGEIEYEKEPVALSYPDAFDALLIRELCTKYREKRTLTQSHTREDILCLMHLGAMRAGKFQPNLACAMLFSSDPRSIVPGARIRFMRFEGHSEGTGQTLSQIKDEYVDGPLPLQIRTAEQIIMSQIRNFTRLGADGRFYTHPEYPSDVWLEALVNAVSHRSYSLKNMMIYVRMFDDRLVVESPGGFPPPTTPRNIYEIHNPRNPRIMDALYYLDYVHCAHEGTARMRDMMAEANLPSPEFDQKQLGHHQVHVTLRNNMAARKIFVDEDAVSVIGRALFETLTNDERLIINYIAERGNISVSDANRLLNNDWRTAKNKIVRLVERDILIKEAKTGKTRDPSQRYVLNRIGRKARRPNGR